MKTLSITIILSVLLFRVDFAIAQNSQSDDRNLRAASASYAEEQFDLNFKTSYAKTYADILFAAHRNMSAYPEIKISDKLPASDKLKLERLLTQLKELRNNPPTWDTILKEKEDNIAIETGPPTAPVFFGDVKTKPNSSGYGSKASQAQNSGTFTEVQGIKPVYEAKPEIIKSKE